MDWIVGKTTFDHLIQPQVIKQQHVAGFASATTAR